MLILAAWSTERAAAAGCVTAKRKPIACETSWMDGRFCSYRANKEHSSLSQQRPKITSRRPITAFFVVILLRDKPLDASAVVRSLCSVGFFYLFIFCSSVWFFSLFSGRGASRHGCQRDTHTHTRTIAKTKTKAPPFFTTIKINCVPPSLAPSLPGQVSSRWRQRGMEEREEVKGHSWVGRECQGAGACRL